MKTGRIYQSIIKIVADYRSRLAVMEQDDFMRSPPAGGWSFSEVYSHIFDASLLSLMALQKAAKGDGEDKKTGFIVQFILFLGSLPPGKKYKVPAQLAGRAKKINLLAAEQLITDFELQLAKIYPYLKDARPNSKIKHPRLGYLDAKQWLQFIALHLSHHLKQLKRIEKSFLAQPNLSA